MNREKIGVALILVGSFLFFIVSLITIFISKTQFNQAVLISFAVASTLLAFLFSRLFKYFKKEKIGNVVFGLLLVFLIFLIYFSTSQLRVVVESVFYAILSGSLFAEIIKFRK